MPFPKCHSTNDVVKYMFEYQKNNNITRQCMTNVQTLFSIIKNSFPNTKTKVEPRIVLSENPETGKMSLTTIHFVLVTGDGKVIDPSYEY